jgi:PDDEXK-like uncharacterized protein DUF3799
MTGPGLYYSMPAAEYHADPCDEPSLSSSIANILLSATPRHARFAHPRLNPQAKSVSTRVMDLGSVTHELLLGSGSGFEVSPFDDYRTKAGREWREDVIERGKIPIKAAELDAAVGMADSVRRILAEIPGLERALLDGTAEAVAIWRDTLGPMCRTMIDWLDLENGIIYDLKTTGTGIGDRSLTAKIAGENTAFDMRASFRQRALDHFFPERAGNFIFRWIFVESSEPFEARVFEADETTRTIGERRAEFAIAKWHECLTTNSWPGYPRKIETPNYPDWAIEDMHL